MSAEEGPETVGVKATEARPYRYAVWCTIGSGKPFANTIVGGNWSEDGQKLWLWLDTHSFLETDPDEVLELVPETMGLTDACMRDVDARWDRLIAERPTTKASGLGSVSCT